MGLNYKTLKGRHKDVRGAQPEATRLRIHRALSWLKPAETADDSDARFIHFWISLNSIYAQNFDEAKVSCQLPG
ncbi:HEPN domain-containing protein [Pontiellaceae bacterium B12227]|nr:HEPN domain-containing protein [Pontiellaceae bacterium B12227]